MSIRAGTAIACRSSPDAAERGGGGSQFAAVRSMDPDLLLKNIVSTVKLAKLFGVPVVHSTINVAGGSGPMVPQRADLLEDDPAIDRTRMNAWEDTAFVDAVRATGGRKLILCALWTQFCTARRMSA